MVQSPALLYTLIKESNSRRIIQFKETLMDSLEDTIAVRAGESFDTEKVEQYLRDHLGDLGAGSLQVRQFPSGASNLTYLLQIGDWEGVLRRPPFGPVPPKAHDMKRESSLLQHINPVFL